MIPSHYASNRSNIVTEQELARLPRQFSAYPLLIGYVVLLVAIPSELIFSPLGAAGTPAGVLSIGLMLCWLFGLAATIRSRHMQNPMKWLLFFYAVAILASYVVGMSRPISTTLEVNSADRALLALCGWLGVALIVIDGVVTREMLDRLLRSLVYGVAFIALLGMLQFFFNLDLAHMITIPGLSANSAFGEVISRSNFRRVTGTASHPIEFGVVLSSVLALAIHYSRFATTSPQRNRLWAATFLIAGALPLSVARSGILGLIIVLAVMFFTWPRAFRLKVAMAIVFAVAGLSVVVPGLIGTFRSLFLNASNDPSTQGRTDDYAPVAQYVLQEPLFGRGFGTFIPSLYRTLDNAYLGTLAEAGVVGIIAVVSLIGGGIVMARRFRRRESTPKGKDLGQSMAAAISVLGFNAFTFDLFGFSMCAGVLFLLLGAVGSMYALQHQNELAPLYPMTNLARVAVGLIVLAVAGTSAMSAKFTLSQWQALGSTILAPPAPATAPALATAGRAATAASVLRDMVTSESSREDLAAEGVTDFDISFADGSLMTGTDRPGSGGPVLTYIVRSSSRAGADVGLKTLQSTLATDVALLQDRVGVPTPERIKLDNLVTNPAYEVRGRPTRTIAGGILLAAVIGAALLHLQRRGSLRSRHRKQSFAVAPTSRRPSALVP